MLIVNLLINDYVVATASQGSFARYITVSNLCLTIYVLCCVVVCLRVGLAALHSIHLLVHLQIKSQNPQFVMLPNVLLKTP